MSNKAIDNWKKLTEALKKLGRPLENTSSQPDTENNPPTNDQVIYKTKQN